MGRYGKGTCRKELFHHPFPYSTAFKYMGVGESERVRPDSHFKGTLDSAQQLQDLGRKLCADRRIIQLEIHLFMAGGEGGAMSFQDQGTALGIVVRLRMVT